MEPTFESSEDSNGHGYAQVGDCQTGVEVPSKAVWDFVEVRRFAYLILFLHLHFELNLLDDAVDEGIGNFAILLVVKLLVLKVLFFASHVHCLIKFNN
jgi:hypothetical protein